MSYTNYTTTADLSVYHVSGWYYASAPASHIRGAGRTASDALDDAALNLCADAPPYAALAAYVDVPLDGPSEDEEGGEGGEPPPDEALAWERLHAACIAAAHPLGGPARCDVRGCPSLGVDRTVGGVRAYRVTLCGPHAAELSTAVGVAS